MLTLWGKFSDVLTDFELILHIYSGFIKNYSQGSGQVDSEILKHEVVALFSSIAHFLYNWLGKQICFLISQTVNVYT